MVRLLLSALVAGLFVCAGAAVAEEKKDKATVGTFESYKDGVLVIKADGKTMEYKVGPDFKTTVWSPAGDTSKEGLARESFRDLKSGTPVTVNVGEGDRVTTVTIGKKKQ